MYVYINSETNLWTVGFYSPDGKWHPDSDHSIREEAAERVAWLNGSGPTMPQRKSFKERLAEEMEKAKIGQPARVAPVRQT